MILLPGSLTSLTSSTLLFMRYKQIAISRYYFPIMTFTGAVIGCLTVYHVELGGIRISESETRASTTTCSTCQCSVLPLPIDSHASSSNNY